MAGDTLPAERLRHYLSELKPAARALLVAELERGLLRGDEVPGTDLVLQELRRTMRESGQVVPRTGNPSRVFFHPIEPFIVDDAPVREHPGRIARAALEPIWAWISRDLLPAEAKAFSDDVSQALLASDQAKSELLTRAMQDRAAQAMAAALAGADADDKARRRLTGQIPVANGIDAAREVLAILQSRDALAAFGAQLPGHLNALADAKLQHVKALLDVQLAKKPEIFVHALVLVMSRLATSWQLIRLATKAAESDQAARVAGTPFAPAVTIVLVEVERLVGELKTDLKSGRGVAVIALLKVIHDAARGLRTEMDLSVDSPWGRQLAAIRTEISNLLKSEIESAPGRMRRLVRPRPAKEIAAGSALDADDVAEIEALIGFVDACRKYAGEIALNEVTLRAFSELQQYLESSPEALLDGLRNAGEGDRRFRQSQLEAVARFGGKVFGGDYAATLNKAAEVALATNYERKAAAAKAG
jgi:hypothetical protein